MEENTQRFGEILLGRETEAEVLSLRWDEEKEGYSRQFAI